MYPEKKPSETQKRPNDIGVPQQRKRRLASVSGAQRRAGREGWGKEGEEEEGEEESHFIMARVSLLLPVAGERVVRESGGGAGDGRRRRNAGAGRTGMRSVTLLMESAVGM